VLGAGILAIPSTIEAFGLGVGMLSLVIVALLSVYSIWMMLEASDASSQKTYENMVEATFPGWGRGLTTFFILLLIFGALAGFLIIIGDILCGENGIVPSITSVQAWYTQRDVLVFIFTSVFIFPLSMLRNISKLEYSSFAAVAIIIFFTFVIIIISCKSLVDGTITFEGKLWYPNDFSKFFNAMPIVALAYTCQVNVFSTWEELERPTVKRMNYVNIFSLTLSGVLYILVGFFGYVLYPNTSANGGNVLKALPSSDFFTVVRAFFVFAIMFHYPVLHFAFRATIEQVIFANYEFSWIRHTIETIIIISTTLIWSIEFPSLADVFSLTGALAAFSICFIVPSVCYMRLVHFTYAKEPVDCTLANIRKKIRHLILPFFVALLGTIAMFVGIVTSIQQLIKDFRKTDINN